MTPTEALAAALHRIHPGPRPWPGGLTDDEMADHVLAALDGWTLVPTAAPAEGLFSEAEAPRSLVSRADEWIALTDPPEIAALNVRGFAVWLDLKRKTQPAEGRCLCGGPWPCPDQDAPNYRSEAYAPHGLAQPAAPAEGLREALDAHPWVWDTLPGDVQDAINGVPRKWSSPAVARRAEIARNAELRKAAMAYLAHLDTDQGENNSGQMLEWAATEDRLREDLRAALERTDR